MNNKITGEFNKDIETIQQKVTEKLLPICKCPICGKNSFELVNGYFANGIQSNLYTFNFGGQAIPAIGLVCNGCGNILQFALGSLDLLPTKNN